MHKAFENFWLGSKAEEEAAEARGVPYEVTRRLVEIRDVYPTVKTDPDDPWVIRRKLSADEILSGKLMMSENDMLLHVMGSWSMDQAEYVVQGHIHYLSVVDSTDSDHTKTYQSKCVFSENNLYEVDLKEVMGHWSIQPGDEIGLFWNSNIGAFIFKLLNRASYSR